MSAPAEEGLKGFMKIMQETADRGEFVIRSPFIMTGLQNLAPRVLLFISSVITRAN